MKIMRPLIRQGSGIVYHYTTLDNFFVLLDGTRYGYHRLWASSIFTMNEPFELFYGCDKLKIMIERDDEKNNLSSYFSIFVPYIEVPVSVKCLDKLIISSYCDFELEINTFYLIPADFSVFLYPIQ